MTFYQKLRGTRDYLPPESETFRLVEEKVVEVINLYGYREIITPLLERKELFIRSVGETTDIVEKEMFTFRDKGGREVALRPEGTAPAVRAYLEGKIHKKEKFSRFFYRGSFFRYERPQAGREREFHQIGVEAIGEGSPHLDAEIISLGDTILKTFNLKDYTLELGSVGCVEDRKKFILRIKENLETKKETLCEDCMRRLKKNPLRIFDCKREKCMEVARELPSLLESLCDRCSEHLNRVRNLLENLRISYHLHPHLVRGIDYYTSTTFEFQHNLLGAQKTILAGGRYDNLVEELGGISLPACGFALGVERLILALNKEEKLPSSFKKMDIFVCYISEREFDYSFLLLENLRKEGLRGEMDLSGKNLKKQLKKASDLGVKFSLIVGEEEMKKGTVMVKDMEKGVQEEVTREEIVSFLKRRLGK